MQNQPVQAMPGDRLVFSAGGVARCWTITAINNRVVKYLEENGRYGQMPVTHLAELLDNNQGTIEKQL
jgi:hypothetical protein